MSRAHYILLHPTEPAPSTLIISPQPTRQALSYTAVYPSGSLGTLLFQGVLVEDLITDGRGDTNNARPFATISSVHQNAGSAAGGTETTLSAGSSGFWGMGIYNVSHHQEPSEIC